MTPDLVASISGIGLGGITQGAAVFLRVGPMMGLVPGFSEQSIPVRIRLALALAMTMIVAASLPTPLLPEPNLSDVLHLLGTETLAGLLLGIGLRLTIFTLQVAGAIAAQATSLSQILGGAGAEPLPAFGHVLVMAGLALAMMMNLHVHIAAYVITSYQVIPAGTLPSGAMIAEWGTAATGRCFALALQIAMPFVVISVLYNLTLGVINRAMPQLMVALVGAPVITFGGLALLALLAPGILSVWLTTLRIILRSPFGPWP